MRSYERLERLEAALDHLRRTAVGQLVVVEGPRDVAALGALGVGGDPIVVHRGRTLAARVDDIARLAAGRTVIVLTDWDRTGGRLFRRLHDALVGRVVVDADCRRRLATACHEKCVEHVPSELAALRTAAAGR